MIKQKNSILSIGVGISLGVSGNESLLRASALEIHCPGLYSIVC